MHHTFWWIHRDVCLSGRRGACESWPDSVVHASTSVRIRYKFGRCDARLFCMRTLNHSIPATRFYRVMRDRIKYNFTSRCRYCCGGSHPQSPMSAAGIEEQSLGKATRNPERRQVQEQSPRTPRDYRGGWNRNGTNSTDASAATDVSGTKQKTIQTSVLSGLNRAIPRARRIGARIRNSSHPSGARSYAALTLRALTTTEVQTVVE